LRYTPGYLRPVGGTKKFRRNCRLFAEHDAVVVTDRNGTTTRFPLDATENAPAKMVHYLLQDPFMVVDGRGRGVITSDDVLWDGDEQSQFCTMAHLEEEVVNAELPPLRKDAVRLEEPKWLRLYLLSVGYVMTAGVILAALGRAFDLPVWLLLPIVPWLLLYPVVRRMGYFAPRRVGPAEIRLRKEGAEAVSKKSRRGRKPKAPAG
jgi:hypothetical protein